MQKPAVFSASRQATRASLLSIVFLLSCASRTAVPPPQRVEWFCGTQQFSERALVRVVGSVVGPGNQGWSQSILKKDLTHTGGAIAYWNDLKLPNPYEHSAPTDRSMHVTGALVLDRATKGPNDSYYSLRLYLLVPINRSPSGAILKPKTFGWFDFQTTDGEDVCI